MRKTLRSLLAYCLAVLLLVQSAPFAFAEEPMPSVTVADNSCTVGSSVTMIVTGENFENLAALPLELYYDADVLTLNNVSIGSAFTPDLSDINTGTAGKIVVALIYSGDDGISVSSETLLYLNFTVADDAVAGDTDIVVTVGNARYADFSPMTVSSNSGTLTINERVTPVSTFYLSGSTNDSTFSKGDTVTLQVYNSWMLGVSAGTFLVSFDDELFKVKNAAFSNELLQGECLTVINDNVAGQVSLSFVSDEVPPLQVYSLFSVELEVIGDVDTTTSLTYAVTEAHKDETEPYNLSSSATQVTLEKLPEVVDYPNLSVYSTEFAVGKDATSTLTLEASDVAAADFYLHFDPEILEVVSVEKLASKTDSKAYIEVDETTWDEGVVQFTYLNTAGTVQDLPLLKITWNVISAKTNAELAVSGSGVVDVNLKDVALDYVGETFSISKQKVAKPIADTTEFTYNGKEQTYTVAYSPFYSVNGNTRTNAGSQTVTVTLNDTTNYEWEDGTITPMEFNFAIDKATLTIIAKNRMITYGEAARNNGVTYIGFKNSETASVLSGALSYSYSYEQYDNVGEYEIVPSGVSSSNYEITYEKGSLKVEQKELGISWDNTELAYNGKAQKPTAIATGIVNNDTIKLTVGGAEKNIGSYTATVTGITGAKAGNYRLPADVTKSFTISKGTVVVTAPKAKDLSYTGEEQILITAGATNGGTMKYALGTSGTKVPTAAFDTKLPVGTNAGTYYVWYYVDGGDNYETTAKNCVPVTISKQKVTKPTADTTEFTYNGKKQTYSVADSPLYLVSGNTRTNAGSQTVTVTLKDTTNYEWEDGTITAVKFTFAIDKKAQTAPVVSKVDETISKKADGVITGVDSTMEYSTDGSSYVGISSEKIDNLSAGTYYVRVKGDDNHHPSPATMVKINAGRKLQVTYIADGVPVATEAVDYGGDATAPAIPEKIGYTQVAPTWNRDGKNIIADTEIHAVYTINKYTVIIKIYGEIVDTQTIAHGGNAVLPEIPAKDGYDETAPYWDSDGKNIVADTEIHAVYTKNGVTVSGTVTSYLSDTNDVTVALFAAGSATADYTAIVKGKSANFSIDGVVADTYTMKVSKANHVTREYTVTVGDMDVTQDAKIHPKGDVTGDGNVNIIDVNRANLHYKNKSLLSGYEKLCADVTGEGSVNIIDVNRLNLHYKNKSLLW